MNNIKILKVPAVYTIQCLRLAPLLLPTYFVLTGTCAMDIFFETACATISKLKRLYPTIFNYDLKYGSKVIYGDKNILDLIPEMDVMDTWMTSSVTTKINDDYNSMNLLHSFSEKGLVEKFFVFCKTFFTYPFSFSFNELSDSTSLQKSSIP